MRGSQVAKRNNQKSCRCWFSNRIFAILDEPDSGLDIDSVKSVAEAINKLIDTGAGVLVITHYARILRYLKKLDYVHVVARGKVIKSGGKELAEELEAKGYSWLGIEEDK